MSPEDLQNLEAAEIKWAATQPLAYSYERRTACFCTPETTEWHRVTVMAGFTTSVVRISTGDTLYFSVQPEFSIDDLFRFIRGEIKEPSTHRIRLRFSPDFGYPTLIGVSASPGIADGGYTTYVRNFTVLEGIE